MIQKKSAIHSTLHRLGYSFIGQLQLDLARIFTFSLGLPTSFFRARKPCCQAQKIDEVVNLFRMIDSQ